MFFKPKVAQQDSKDNEKPSTSKNGNICIIKENLPEKFQSTLHLVINNAEKKPQIWDNQDSKVHNVWLF